MRRVPFENMIYIADGPSDIPAFSLVKQKGGTTFAIYPREDGDALKASRTKCVLMVELICYAEADYSEGTTANFMDKKIKFFEIADRIREKEADSKFRNSSDDLQFPRHFGISLI